MARFLFPGIFLYDSCLSGGADHIAALFTVPLFAAAPPRPAEPEPRLMVLIAIMLAGTAMTKLTGLLMLMPVAALVVGARAVVFAVRARRRAPRG